MFFKQRFCQLVLHEELNASPSDVYVASFFFLEFLVVCQFGMVNF